MNELDNKELEFLVSMLVVAKLGANGELLKLIDTLKEKLESELSFRKLKKDN